MQIKDLLWGKLYNTDIHTYVLCFKEIEQWEKESLAAYIQQFKTEAKRCNFTNDAATIRIFIKGLKNAQSVATHIYEKGPQTFTDTISKVEQLTAMIIPPSMVNMMSHEEDCCFQCQEQGHIAWNCPHIRCYKCDKYGHTVMDCPHRIPPSGTHVIHHKPKPPRRCHARSSSRHHHEDRGTGKVNPDHNLIFADIAAWVVEIHTEAAQGHNTRINTATTGAAHNGHTPSIEDYSHRSCCDTHINHITDHPHIEVLQLTTDCNRSCSRPSYQSLWEVRLAQIKFTFQQIMRQTTPQEELKGENQRSTHGLLQLRWTFQWLRRGI